MKILDILIFGPAGPTRDYYELELLRRHLEVATSATVAEAVSILERHLIKMLAMVGNSIDASRTELLRLTQIRQTIVPVFFLPDRFDGAREDGAEQVEGQDPVQIIPELLQSLQNTLVAEVEPSHSKRAKSAVAVRRSEYPLKYADAIAAFEAEWVTEVLKRFHGNISRASREMGMARRSLQLRIRLYQINMKVLRLEPLENGD